MPGGVFSARAAFYYDPNGNMVKQKTFTGAGSECRVTRCAYDRFGNRDTMTATGADTYTTVYACDKNNRLLTETKTEGATVTVTTYTYDANGAETKKTVKRGSTVVSNETKEYNGFGQLVKAQSGALDYIATYAYRPDGLRHQKAVTNAAGGNARTVVHHWDGQNMVAESNGITGVSGAKYLRGAGLICQLIDSNTFYYLFNPHGDVVQRADQSGNLSTLYDYDAFGNNTRRYNVGYQPTDGLDTDPNPFRYCGEYFDSELGELYLRNRNYNSASGRFTAEDPIRDGKNWYGYCGGNPVAFKDPLGLKDPDLWYGNEKSLNERKREQSKMGKGGDHSGISSPDYWNNQQYIYDNNVYTPTAPPAPATPSGGNLTPEQMARTGEIAEGYQSSTTGSWSGGTMDSILPGHYARSPRHPEDIDTTVPPPPETGYVPPKKSRGKPEKVRDPNRGDYGWPSNDGGVWVPDNDQHGGAGWTVQYPGGRHRHVYPSGTVRTFDAPEITGEQVLGGLIVVGAVIAIAVIAADDASVVGIADDFLLAPLIGFLLRGAQMAAGAA